MSKEKKIFIATETQMIYLLSPPIVVIATVITSFVCLILKRDRQRAALSLRKS